MRWTRVLGAILIAGLSLFWPSLEQGLYADDFVAKAMIDGTFAAPRGPLDLFNFASGQADDVTALKRLGSVPWWAPPDFRVSFMRPLSSALWHLDRALFGDWYVGYHLHSLFTWVLLACVAALFYRSLLPPRIGLIALPFLALDHSLHFPTVWLSNRGGLYATAWVARPARTFGPRTGQPSMLALSALLCVIALALASGVSDARYVLAIRGFIPAAPRPERARDGGLALKRSRPRRCWRDLLLLRTRLGYGATGSGAYVDPTDETALFLLALVGRVPVLIADMMFNVSAAWWDHGSPWRRHMMESGLFTPQLWSRMPDWRFFHTLIGLGACALVLSLYVKLVRRQPEHDRRAHLCSAGPSSYPSWARSLPFATMAAFLGLRPARAGLSSAVARAFGCARVRRHAAAAYAADAPGLAAPSARILPRHDD